MVARPLGEARFKEGSSPGDIPEAEKMSTPTPQTETPVGQPTQPAPTSTSQTPQPTVTPAEEKLRQKLSEILGDLIIKAQETAFELATIECPKAKECPLAMKTRELVVSLKKLLRLRKELS